MADTGSGLAPKRQYLFMTIHEAWGLSKEQEPVWDENFQEGYVRVEVRGGPRVQKVTTFSEKVKEFQMTWRQDLRVELTEQSKELRIMLCKEKSRDQTTAKKGTSVVAACGIFIKDIIEAVPIDKEFELFKPGDVDTSLGGYIRIMLRTGPNVPTVPPISEHASPTHEDEPTEAEPATDTTGGGKAMTIIRTVLLLAGMATTIAFFRFKTQKKQ